MASAKETSDNKFKLISSDNKTFVVSEGVIKQNEIWGAIYECGGKPDEEIPIKDIDGKTLKKVVAFCEKFVNDQPYKAEDVNERAMLRNDNRVTHFFKDIKKSNELNEIITAANYLNNQRLIDACLMHIHRNLEGLDIEGIREALHLKNDFTAEEEKAFKQSNRFSFTDLEFDFDNHIHQLGLDMNHIHGFVAPPQMNIFAHSPTSN